MVNFKWIYITTKYRAHIDWAWEHCTEKLLTDYFIIYECQRRFPYTLNSTLCLISFVLRTFFPFPSHVRCTCVRSVIHVSYIQYIILVLVFLLRFIIIIIIIIVWTRWQNGQTHTNTNVYIFIERKMKMVKSIILFSYKYIYQNNAVKFYMYCFIHVKDAE